MKKMVALALAIAMLVSLAGVASAMQRFYDCSACPARERRNIRRHLEQKQSPIAVRMEESMSTVMIM